MKLLMKRAGCSMNYRGPVSHFHQILPDKGAFEIESDSPSSRA